MVQRREGSDRSGIRTVLGAPGGAIDPWAKKLVTAETDGDVA